MLLSYVNSSKEEFLVKMHFQINCYNKYGVYKLNRFQMPRLFLKLLKKFQTFKVYRISPFI